MTLNTVCVFVSSLSFYIYVASYFISPHMKNEFKRFNLEKIGSLTIFLQFLGATGLLVGLKFNLILTLAALGLGLMMFFGLLVRIKCKDSFWVSIPAIFYMILNFFIFFTAIQ